MGYDFNADEVYLMAEKIEANGAKFYRDAAAKTTDGESKKMLLTLAEMEDAHQKTFRKLHEELTDKEKTETVFDPQEESILYLRALADTRVFYEKEIDLTSMTEILKAALTAEKDSIVFYLGMKDMVPKELGKKNIDNIIKEEMEHIKIIGNKLRTLK